MDRFSFLNAAHTEFFDQLYEQYLENPDVIDTSWRVFFQGFDFGLATYNAENAITQMTNIATQNVVDGQVPDKILKETN
jgi:2-oxoglutarate dehydrogenase E1 component